MADAPTHRNTTLSPRPAAGPVKPAAPTRPAHERVLLVEDEGRLREMLTRAVAEMGFEPAAVGSAEAALRAMDADPRAILLLDLNLPGMGGLEFLAAARARWPDVQAIILTGFGDLAAAKQAIRLDAVDFLTKPCALGDLEVALGRARARAREKSDPLAAAGKAGKLEFPPRDAAAESAPMEEVERQHILAALERHAGNRTAAAAELGISLRKLYYRLAQYQKGDGQ